MDQIKLFFSQDLVFVILTKSTRKAKIRSFKLYPVESDYCYVFFIVKFLCCN